RDNRKLGEFVLGGLPPAPAGARPGGVPVTYDINRVLGGGATIRHTGAKTGVWVEQAPGRLSQSELAAAGQEMGRPERPPRREPLPNTLALARAEARFVEVTGAAREALGQAIAVFRGVLETHDAAEIAEARERLLALVGKPS